MKRMHILFFIFIISTLFLSGCSEKQINDATPSSTEKGTVSSGWRSQNCLGSYFLETDQACYNLESEMIYFAPAGSKRFSLLCSRPDCTHNNEDCNAYGGKALGYYNGMLYSIVVNDSGIPCFQLVSMDLNGSNHTAVCNLLMPQYPNGQRGGGYSFFFCDGYVYYVIRPSFPDYPIRLVRTNLITKETEEPWKDSVTPDMNGGFSCQFSDGCWYIEMDMTSSDGETQSMIVRADPETGTIERILDNPDGITITGWWVEESTILYFEKGRGLCQLDLRTGEDACQLEVTGDAGGRAIYDEAFIYTQPYISNTAPRALCIYSRDYRLLDSVALTDELFYVTATKDTIFFGTPAENGYHISSYINKSDIGSGNLELIYIDQ